MGLINSNTQQYYQGNDFGNYQFISLDDIISQFQIAYVGEDKIISKIKRADIAFFAQRALAELSFDTFKSCKSQEINLPPTLQMILPHDYVNYTKISWIDSSGIKHLLYPTRHTSNPFNITQDSDGNYVFPSNYSLGVNMDFSDPITAPWVTSTPQSWDYDANGVITADVTDAISVVNGALTFTQHPYDGYAHNESAVEIAWQEIDVTGINTLEISADGTSQAAATNITGGTLRFGITGISPNDYNPPEFYNSPTDPTHDGDDPVPPNTGPSRIPYESSNLTSPDVSSTPWLQTLEGNDGYLEWLNGESSSESLMDNNAIDVSAYNKVYIVITSRASYNGVSASTADTTMASLISTNSIDNLLVHNTAMSTVLSSSVGDSSVSWNNYKSSTPSENNNDDYEDDTYWPYDGGRYGLDPSHAQVNGSFYIDCNAGKIHFSSNLSGQTIVLDYISDSLGTDEEMQVHKFAEEAMYKWIAYGILSTRANTQEYLVQRLKKEKFAETRKAKLRLSNIKLEEITQILRGKSKQIKH
mgnify:CR=1 FL=1|jgi:hypothetical protein